MKSLNCNESLFYKILLYLCEVSTQERKTLKTISLNIPEAMRMKWRVGCFGEFQKVHPFLIKLPIIMENPFIFRARFITLRPVLVSLSDSSFNIFLMKNMSTDLSNKLSRTYLELVKRALNVLLNASYNVPSECIVEGVQRDPTHIMKNQHSEVNNAQSRAGAARVTGDGWRVNYVILFVTATFSPAVTSAFISISPRPRRRRRLPIIPHDPLSTEKRTYSLIVL